MHTAPGIKGHPQPQNEVDPHYGLHETPSQKKKKEIEKDKSAFLVSGSAVFLFVRHHLQTYLFKCLILL